MAVRPTLGFNEFTVGPDTGGTGGTGDTGDTDRSGAPDITVNPFAGVDAAVIQQQQAINMAQGQLGGISGALGGISTGADPRFAEFEAGQFGLLQEQQDQAVLAERNQLARSGVTGSAALNQVAGVNRGFDVRRGALRGDIGLQQLGRQDQARLQQAGIIGQGIDLGQARIQNQTISPTLGIAQTAAENAGLSGAGGLLSQISVLCSLAHKKGDMPHRIYRAGTLYGARLDPVIIEGYHAWAKPLVRLLERQNWLYVFARPVILSWAVNMAYQMGVESKPNRIGGAINGIAEPACGLIGRVIRVRKRWNLWKGAQYGRSAG